MTRDNYAPWIGKRAVKRADAGGKYAPWMGKRKRADGKYAPWMGKRSDSGHAPGTGWGSVDKRMKGLLAVARYGKRGSLDMIDGMEARRPPRGGRIAVPDTSGNLYRIT